MFVTPSAAWLMTALPLLLSSISSLTAAEIFAVLILLRRPEECKWLRSAQLALEEEEEEDNNVCLTNVMSS